MAISRVQYQAQNGAGSVTSLGVTLPAASTAGNLLVAIVAHATSSSNSLTISPPSGWSTAVGPITTEATTLGRVYLFYRWNCPGGVATYTFTSSGAAGMVAAVWEFSGVQSSSDPLDKTASSANQTGGGAALVTGTTAATTQAAELVIGALASHQSTGPTWGSILNSFTAETPASSTGGTGNPDIQPLYKIVSATGTQNSGATPSASSGGAGAIASFKAATGTTGNAIAAGAKFPLKAVGKAINAGASLALRRFQAAGATLALNSFSRTTMPAGALVALTQAKVPAAAAASVALSRPTSANPIAAGASLALQNFVPPPPTGLTVFLQGQDISLYVEESSYSGTSVLGQGAGVGAGGTGHATTCEFDVYLGPAASAIGKNTTPSGSDLVRQGEVQVLDARGTTIFGGFATVYKDITDILDPKTHVTCQDFWQHLDRIQVNEQFFSVGDTDIIKQLLTNYAPFVDQSMLPDSNNQSYPVKRLKDTLRACIQKLADENGWMVWIDPDGAIHYVSPTNSSTAPFGLSDDPDSVTTQGHQISDFTVDDTGLINRVTFYGGKFDSPDFTQDLSVQANGTNKTFFLMYQSHQASDGAYHLVLDGAELSLGSLFDSSEAGTFKSAGGTSDALINADARVISFDVAPPQNTVASPHTLTFKYRYQTPLVIILSSTPSFNFFGGWYEGRISDSSVFDNNLALQRCRVLLAQQAFGLVSGAATLWTPGIQAGQLLHITNEIRGIDDTFLVQQVTTKPLGGGEFEYDIQFGAWNWNLLDILVQNARILNPTDSNTEEDISIIQAQESLTSATVTIAITKHTSPSGQYFSGQSNTLSGFFTVTG